jgi:hypothetical protein
MHVITESCGLRAPGFFEINWKRWGLAFDFIFDHDAEYGYPWMLHVHFLLLNVFLHFPFAWVPSSKREPYMREWQQWGFSLCDDAVHFHWNERIKIWNLPWFSSVFRRHEVRRADGSWVPYVGSWEQGKEPDGREELTFPYQYKLRRGEVQNRMATVHVGRMAWRPTGFTWTGLFEKVRQSIDVAFDDEVGERSGSWKGGTVGCGYEMLPGESPEQTLRRMERERIFA